MRISTAYFAGAGTVAAAIVAGLGGGLLFSNIVSPHAPRTEMSKLELRMSAKPVHGEQRAVGTGSLCCCNGVSSCDRSAEPAGTQNKRHSQRPKPQRP